MLTEHSIAVLKIDIPEHGLHAGDVGTFVHLYDNYKAYEVEFVAGDGATVALLTLPPESLRNVGPGEMLHTRIITQP